MAVISVRVKFEHFTIAKQNDKGGNDEPFVLTLFAKLDAPLGNQAVPITAKTVPIHFPDGLGHGDLGPGSTDMSVTGRNRVPVPAAIGEWKTTIDTANLEAAFSGMRNCQIGFAVVFLEEDSTLDSSVQAMLPELKKEVRRRANTFLHFVLGEDPDLPANLPARPQILAALAAYRDRLRRSGLDVNGAVNGGALMDHVLAAALPGEIGKAIGKAVIPGAELGNLLSAALQAADPDELVGVDGRMCPFFDMVGLAHAPIEFTLDTARTISLDIPMPPGFDPPTIVDTSKGLYKINGFVDRTDTDEPPVLAAVRGPGEEITELTVFARRIDGDTFRRLRSTDRGKTFDQQLKGDFNKRPFKSGPSASTSSSRRTWCVAGLGEDDEVWFALSQDAGDSWEPWTRISPRKNFTGAPAVALGATGAAIHVVARDADNFYWFTTSSDAGKSWAAWQRIGGGVFLSSPAIVRLSPALTRPPLPDILVVAGLGLDKRVWFSRFTAAGNLADQGWHPISAGPEGHPTVRFTSAPAMIADGKENILLLCRASDLRYWRVDSFDGGQRFSVGTSWIPHGFPEEGRVKYADDGTRSGDLQRLYSAPAIVASDDLEIRVMFGLTPTLSLWRNRHSRHENAFWRGTTDEPEAEIRVFYY